MTTRCARRVATAFALALAGCAGSPPEPGGVPAEASLAVDVYGFEAPMPAASEPTPDRVEILIDVTSSMQRPAPLGGTRLDLARGAAAQLLASADAGTIVAARAFGHLDGPDCSASQRIEGGSLEARLRSASSRSEASLASAVDEVANDLDADGSARATRVVVLTDLDASCGGDLCAAAARLVERGAWLQVMPVGDAAPPACLASLLPSPAAPRGDPVTAAPFSVTVDRGERGPEVVAIGRAGEGFVAVPPGVLSLTVHLDPPERIGPFRLEPGASARVRVLDDGAAATPNRTWRLERGHEAVGRAFPPPESLPEER